MKDPFEAAFEDQDSPPESPVAPPPPPQEAATAVAEAGPSAPAAVDGVGYDDDDYDDVSDHQQPPAGAVSQPAVPGGAGGTGAGRGKDEEDDEEENMADVELGKFSAAAAAAGGGDPDKMAKMQAILSQFTEDQMSRYESFRRSGFQKSNMKRLLASILSSKKISMPMTIVVSGIAKMFVGELVETGRMIMAERGESGPIRPCHIREAYRRLKLEGKIPKRSVPRLFR